MGIGVVTSVSLAPSAVFLFISGVTWLLLRPSGSYQAKMWRRRLFDQSGETITPKINGLDGYQIQSANVVNHGSDDKHSGHFAAVRALIRGVYSTSVIHI